jgi:uncharacterized protein
MQLLERFELSYLHNWLKRPDRKPLLLRGARQVGKSTLVRELARQASLNLIELDFEKNPEYAELFKSNEPKTILSVLSAQFNQVISVDSTLLFLDEIQKTPQLLATLRYFYEKMPELAVIATGSLLDFSLRNINFSMPVGRIEYLYLMPMSFEAFLLATNKAQLLNFIRQYQLSDEIPASIHQSLLESVRIYFIVGGLPEVVSQYVISHNYADVERTKKNLVNAYQDDFSKYATIADQNRIRVIFNKIPRMLGEKFKYSHIDPEQKSTTIKAALDHLNLARIVYIVYHTDANGLPLGSEINEKRFKTFFLDVGLVASALNLNVLDFDQASDFTLVNSGKMTEQFVAQELLQYRECYEPPVLQYWMREKKSASAEVDFVISYQSQIIPIAVKAGATGSLKSMHYFLSEKNLPLGVRFCNQQPSLVNVKTPTQSEVVSYQLLTLPFYLIGQLKRLLGTL